MNNFNKNIVKTNRKESFWFHAIRSINYFSYRYWWLILIFLFIILSMFFFLFRNTKKYPAGIVGNPIAMLDSLSLNLDKCCVYPPIPTRPQAPQENCRVFFSGLIVGGQAVQSNISEVYVLDGSSEFVGAGEYPDNTKAFPNSVSTTFDGIAIDAKTRLIIYSKSNFQGEVLLDIDGPVIINNIKWKNDSRYNHCNTDIFPANLQNTYPQSVRRWSNSNMHDWSFGSCKIMCSN